MVGQSQEISAGGQVAGLWLRWKERAEHKERLIVTSICMNAGLCKVVYVSMHSYVWMCIPMYAYVCVYVCMSACIQFLPSKSGWKHTISQAFQFPYLSFKQLDVLLNLFLAAGNTRLRFTLSCYHMHITHIQLTIILMSMWTFTYYSIA